MRARKFYQALEQRIPAELSCAWDHDGIACLPNPDTEIRTVLVTLDITDAAIDTALSVGAQVILSHHPLLFHPLDALDADNATAHKLLRLVRADLAAFSFHTRLDALPGGVNDTLAAALGVSDCLPFGENAMGRIGNLPQKEPFSCFLQRVQDALGVPSVAYLQEKAEVQRIALLGGSGKDFLKDALHMGADVFLTGELGHHAFTDAIGGNLNLVEAGHFYTEQPVCEMLLSLIHAIDDTIQVQIHRQYAVKTETFSHTGGNF